MSKNLFITGTGTEIGKTYVASLFVKKMQEISTNTAYFKAAMSGNVRDNEGTLIPGDAVWVKNQSGISQPLDEMCPYVYEKAYSPHLASKLEGNPVRLNVIKEAFEYLSKKYEYITMEGSGGIVCPLCVEDESLQLEDVLRELELQSIIVASAGLGTINSVVLTVKYMQMRKLLVKGIVFNQFHPGNPLEEDNIKMCEELTGVKVIACVKEGDTNLEINKEILIDLYK